MVVVAVEPGMVVGNVDGVTGVTAIVLLTDLLMRLIAG